MKILKFLGRWGGWIGTILLVIWLAANRYWALATIGVWVIFGAIFISLLVLIIITARKG